MEDKLIPYHATHCISANSVVVFAPHPDDEVFGCGGAILRHIATSVPVHVVIVSDGAFCAADDLERKALIETREAESRKAADILGYGEPEFWHLPDRNVIYGEALVRRIVDEIRNTAANLVYAPSLLEMHPDHRAVAMCVIEAVRRTSSGLLLALYEVGVPLSPNLLLDISDLAERKMAAMECFVSQNEKQRYDLDIAALNRYRTYTLPAEVTAAEAYVLVSAEELANDPFKIYQSEHKRQRELGLTFDVKDIPLVSVIIRSMDRSTISEALDSVALQTYPNIEVVVVNAKAEEHSKLGEWCGRFPLQIIDTGEMLRRSRAGNIGLNKARGDYLIFLDDDDWFMPEHVSMLVDTLTRNPDKKAAYSCVIGVNEQKQPINNNFCHPFDRTLLFVGNYIPIHAVLFSRSIVDGGCRMDETLDLYEDWDFWLQAATYSDFIFVAHFSAYYRIGGQSGQGVRPDPLFAQRISADLFNKWHKQLRREDLLDIVGRAQGLEAKLHTVVAERDATVTNLNRTINEHEVRLINLYQRESELQIQSDDLQVLVNELQKEIMDYRMSTSWRITKPLREVALLRQRFVRLIRLYQNYRQIHPGFRGLVRLVSRSIGSLRKGGIKSLRSNVAMHANSRSTAQQPTLGPVLALKDIEDNTVALPQDVAVHIHIYYADLAPEIRAYLINIPVNFHCYVTTDSQQKTVPIEAAFSGIKNIRALDIRVVENRGRDLAPMIVALGAELAQHEVVLHIHTKRSPHNLELRGWRRYLMLALLGDTRRVTAILHQFAQNEQLGILFPQVYRPVIPFMRIGGNAHYMASLLGRSGNDSAEIDHINPADFPAGAMFWFRGKAIEPLVRMQLTLQDFDEEAGQCDATLAHAIERLFPYFAGKNGLYHQAYMPKQLLSSQPGTVPLSLFTDYCAQGLVNNPVIIFDHNIGGGANRYSRELINTILAENSSVIRIYHADESWLVEWIAADDGLIFSVSGEQELFETLTKAGSKNIIVNSLYGYPNVDDAVSRIICLTERLKANLDCKVHDFYAICPSQHLIDLNGRYCGVPINPSDCNACLKKNPAAYWASSRPVDIAEWRSPFAKLFAAADIISVFDPSSIEILRKAFQVQDSKLRITPHSDGYFECKSPIALAGRLHIGVLGTLIAVKGAAVVNELAEYIVKQGMYIPITVVGQSLVPTMRRIKVLGPYENNELPEILSREGINVILMPTIVPETFSYTISEAMKMGLPIVAFDIGAQGDRVKQYELGKVVPLGSSPEIILAAIQSALNTAKELKK